MTDFPYLTFNNGKKIPQIGLGTFRISPNEVCTEKCLEAMKIGYRHFDTAHFYQNEKGVGEAVLKSGLKREDIFVTSKLWPTDFAEPEKALENMFQRIKLDYVDLVLLHWPYGDYIGAWKALEKYCKSGKIKSIGLSNFYGKELEDILKICEIRPVVDQVRCDLQKNNLEFKKILDKEKMLLVAWSPVKNLDDSVKNNKDIAKMIEKYKKSFFQIVLRWQIQNGNIVIPKSSSVEHMKSNLSIFDFDLTKEEMDILNSIPQSVDQGPPPDHEKRIMSFVFKDE